MRAPRQRRERPAPLGAARVVPAVGADREDRVGVRFEPRRATRAEGGQVDAADVVDRVEGRALEP